MEGEKYILKKPGTKKSITISTTFMHSFIQITHGVPGTLLVLIKTWYIILHFVIIKIEAQWH